MAMAASTCFDSLAWALEFSSSSFARSFKKSANSLMANIPHFMLAYNTPNPSFFSPWNKFTFLIFKKTENVTSYFVLKS